MQYNLDWSAVNRTSADTPKQNMINKSQVRKFYDLFSKKCLCLEYTIPSVCLDSPSSMLLAPCGYQTVDVKLKKKPIFSN